MSATKLRLWRTCRRAYYERYVVPFANRQPAPPSEDMLVGTLVHQELARLAEAGSIEVGDLAILAGLSFSVQVVRRAQAILDSVAHRLDWSKIHRMAGLPGSPLAVEQNVTVHTDRGRTVVGVVDRVDDTRRADGPSELVVVDYKTGQPRTRAQLEDDPQTGIYMAALSPASMVYWFLDDDIEIRIDYQDDLARRALALCDEALDEIQHETAFPGNPSAENCRTCSYKATCQDYGRRVARVREDSRALVTAGAGRPIPTTMTVAELVAERVQVHDGEELLADRRALLDDELFRRAAEEGRDVLVGGGESLKKTVRRQFEDVGLEDAVDVLAAALGLESDEDREEVAESIVGHSVDQARLKEFLAAFTPPLQKKAQKALKDARRVYDVSRPYWTSSGLRDEFA
jgi:hypothetical protein